MWPVVLFAALGILVGAGYLAKRFTRLLASGPDARDVPPHAPARDRVDAERHRDLRAVPDVPLAQPRVATFHGPAAKGFVRPPADRPVEMQRRLIEVQRSSGWISNN